MRRRISWVAAEPSKPKVLEAIAKQGVEVMGEFPTGTQVRAFAGSSGGNPLAIYILSDGSAVVGTRVSADGKILDQKALARLVAKPMADSAAKQLEAASWILDGSKNAPKVVYVFTDANCPYCHHFWQAARPWVESGKVQLRHIMASPSSGARAPTPFSLPLLAQPTRLFNIICETPH